MGTKGREIVGMDVEQLLKLLNMAFADEWLAYYQYWIGAKLVKGPMKEAVIAGTAEPAGFKGLRVKQIETIADLVAWTASQDKGLRRIV